MSYFYKNISRLLFSYFLLIAALMPYGLYAQPTKISGIVKDAGGLPVIGAGIVIKEEGALGCNTDLDGRFALQIDLSLHKTLIIMSLGYETLSLPIGAKRYFDIVLEQDSKVLEEVVLVAYGTQKKISVTGALASVDNSGLKRSPVSNFSSSLAGRLPGLTVTQNSGMPGDERINLNLRGLSTFGDASPLIMIDGVPREDMASLDANEVQNVTILKDAAATAIFGVRGANGVILITTQRGREGKADVSISAETGIQQILWRGNVRLDSWDYAALLNERNANDGRPAAYTPWQIERFRSGEDKVFFPNRDPWKEYTRLGKQSKINANVSGGTDRITYFINASYTDQQGVFKTLPKEVLGYDPSFWMRRVNVRANIDYSITKDLKFSINLSSYLNTLNKIVWGDNLDYTNNLNFDHWGATMVVGGLNRVPPTAPGPALPPGAVDRYGKPLPEGGWVQDGSGYQLYPRMNLGGYIRQMKTTVNSNAALEWDAGRFVKGFRLKAMFSYDLYAMGWIKGTRGYNRYGFHQATGPGDLSYWTHDYSDNAFDGYHAEDGMMFFGGGRGQSSYYKFNTQLSANYTRVFADKHDVTAMVLGQYDNYVSNNPASLFLPYNMLYVSSRATYTFDKRYTAELNLGVNGSEQFAKSNRFGLFPAVSLGWALSEEAFFKNNVDKKWMDYFKLRASYGIVGNDKVADGARFLYLDNIRVGEGGPISTLGRGQYVEVAYFGNKSLTWEKSSQQNYGIDLGFLNGFTFNADFFWEHRSHILISRSTVPLVQGLPPHALPRVNMGKVDNRGFEIVLGYHRIFSDDFAVDISANYNFSRNKVIEADEVSRQTRRGGYLYEFRETGFPIGTNWLLQVDYQDGAGNGFINTQEDLDKFGPMYEKGGFVRSFLGQWKFVDQNGDGVIDIKDQIPTGYANGTPEITYGVSLGLTWKNWDFSALLQGVSHKSGCYVVGMFGDGHITGDWELNAWTKERFERGEKITYQALNSSTLAGGASNERSDFVLSDMSFFRVKNMALGYSLPKSIIKKMGLKNLRLAVQGQNLWTLSKMKTRSMDPEANNENQYPITRNIGVSVQIQL